MSTTNDTFTGWRSIFWPIHNYEIKKFLPMGLMMMCILFNYNILRDVKDALVVNAPGSGAEALSFLKLYGVTPSAIIFMIIFTKLANVLPTERLFSSIIAFFLVFFGAFAFLIYPYAEALHMSPATVAGLRETMPTLHWLFPVVGNWSFSLFYIFSELWGSAVLSMIFWQIANHMTRVNEAKRFYGLFGMIGNVGLMLAGSLIVICTNIAKSVPDQHEAWALNLKIQMGLVVAAGIATLALYKWMQKNVMTDPRLCDPSEKKEKKSKPKLSLMESFRYIVTSPYLGLIATVVLAYGVTINIVEGVWKGQIKIAFPNENDYLDFMGKFTFVTGFTTIILMIVGNNILRRFSWLKAAMITPIMVLVTSIVFFSFIYYSNQHSPMSLFMGTTCSMALAAVIVGLIQNVMSKATKYSLFDSTKQMAYIPLDPELKIKGQAAVEVIGGRAGKSGGAIVQSTLLMGVGGGASLAGLVHILGPIVIAVTMCWILANFGISKRFAEFTKGEKKTA